MSQPPTRLDDSAVFIGRGQLLHRGYQTVTYTRLSRPQNEVSVPVENADATSDTVYLLLYTHIGYFSVPVGAIPAKELQREQRRMRDEALILEHRNDYAIGGHQALAGMLSRRCSIIHDELVALGTAPVK